MHRLFAIFTLIAFLLSGGIGGGSGLVICHEANGETHFETPFNRCCEDSSVSPSDGSETAADASCGVCVDQPIDLNCEGMVPSSQFKHDRDHLFHFTPLFVQIEVPVAEAGQVKGEFNSHASGASTTAHAVVTAVVRTC